MNAPTAPFVIGVLSDTHGRMDSRVFHRFEGVDAILHAGDVGSREVLIDLEALAPAHAVLGNTDPGTDCGRLPLQISLELGDLRVYMAHGHLHPDPHSRVRGLLAASASFRPDLVVVGHSHRPHVGVYNGVVFLNPGSASRPRHGHPPSVARVTVVDGRPEVRLLNLDGNEIGSDASI